MALIKCPECGKEISSTVNICIHCGYILKKSQIEEGKLIEDGDCVSIYKKYKNDNMLFRIIGFIGIALMSVSCLLFFIELMPLFSLKNFDNLGYMQQSTITDEITEARLNLKNYQTIAMITSILGAVVYCFITYHQNKSITEWVKDYNLEKSIEKTLIKIKGVSVWESRKERVAINNLLNGTVYDKNLQGFNLLNTCVNSLFFIFLFILCFNTLQIAYNKAIFTSNIDLIKCISTPLLIICILFLILARIVDGYYQIKLKDKKKDWIKQNVKIVYQEDLLRII